MSFRYRFARGTGILMVHLLGAMSEAPALSNSTGLDDSIVMNVRGVTGALSVLGGVALFSLCAKEAATFRKKEALGVGRGVDEVVKAAFLQIISWIGVFDSIFGL